MEAWFESVLALLALPKFGLSSVFLVAFVSATLLPMGSEPFVFGLVKLNPDLFWSAIVVATAGNTLAKGANATATKGGATAARAARSAPGSRRRSRT